MPAPAAVHALLLSCVTTRTHGPREAEGGVSLLSRL